jgi:DNA-binding response OmpR family regulator
MFFDRASDASGRVPKLGRRELTALRQIILIVDDETDVANTYARVLQRAGFNCLVAYDTAEALALFDSQQPALVLSDINLPTADGFEVARYATQKRPGIPVVLMSARNNASQPMEAARAGAVHFMRKPFSNSELVTIVASLLGNTMPL